MWVVGGHRLLILNYAALTQWAWLVGPESLGWTDSPHADVITVGGLRWRLAGSA